MKAEKFVEIARLNFFLILSSLISLQYFGLPEANLLMSYELQIYTAVIYYIRMKLNICETVLRSRVCETSQAIHSSLRNT